MLMPELIGGKGREGCAKACRLDVCWVESFVRLPLCSLNGFQQPLVRVPSPLSTNAAPF